MPIAAYTSSLARNITRRIFASLPLVLFTTSGVIFINDNVIETSWITGGSMSPTLSPDYETTRKRDLVLWNKWSANTARYEPGDVILFRSPHDPETVAVKRVIGTEGDSITLDPRRRPSRRRDAADLPESRGWDAWAGRVPTVPDGHLWVEGDFWRRSRDSNWYGPISKSLVQGKAVAVVWPLSRFGTRPWEDGYTSKTKVKPGVIEKEEDTAGLVKAIRHG
ncbi:hypothetical protein LTR78_010231 [Recurvomyces mirabilis]|uniref:Mitochondrial inner membrane protease subunit n=1 Tax=Recurvomyces mirabilis TaxID=574656 RepID=A0AAE0WI33_9PEZI|nr:hypothetical protein LTR78_010231 [Recurvomyces mirabilis]